MVKLGRGFITGFDWELYPQTEKFLQKEINNFLKRNSFASKLSKRIEKETSTRLFDWIDHISLPSTKINEKTLLKLNFKEIKPNVYKNPKSVFFPVLLNDDNITEIALKPENIDHFKSKYGKMKIEGEKFSSLRKGVIQKEGKTLLTAIERRGSNDYIIKKSKDISLYKKALKTFSLRKRNFNSDREGIDSVYQLVKGITKKLSKSRTSDAFFRNEREFWECKNKAGSFQKSRQDKLGLGWGNHDHHTYRSSRKNFSKLTKIFEAMGYKCRERFYAGEMAGWGAQILEHPECDIVVFSDTDISKAEKNKDFAHKGLKEKKELGTVGLWVALHGESILQSGMHHLEARFNFEKLKGDLNKKHVKIMKPFSNFPFLKQAFTEGETWKVEKKRLDKLLKDNSISKEQYANFLKHGAIGSHLENLQRRQGFRGFNQDSVSAIIKATDPRKQLHHQGA